MTGPVEQFYKSLSEMRIKYSGCISTFWTRDKLLCWAACCRKDLHEEFKKSEYGMKKCELADIKN